MLRGTDRIMTTHAGALPRSDALRALVFARSNREAYEKGALAMGLRDGVAQTVRKQLEIGIDSVNDGELGKSNFTNYIHERLAGIEARPYQAGQDTGFTSLIRREVGRYGAYYRKMVELFPAAKRPNIVCVGPLTYVGHELVKEDIANFKAALSGATVADAYLPAVTPGTIEHWLQNEFYPNDEAFLFAIADALRPEYQAIVEVGFTLQIDDPDLPDGWQIYPDMSVADYRKYADLRVEALNHALKGIPADKVRLHVCWGSFHGPHQGDIGLEHIVDLIFKVRAREFSIEASNPRHEHEWQVFEKVKLPDGAMLIPGVVGHCTNFIEHPELVAQRLVRYANLVGRENVAAGTDCGLAPRLPDGELTWGKLEALVEGARLASTALWRRA
ncbi:MAG: cobalamin-independent methionine synthase II family protein [Xanthobacteraceae bacterium]